MFDHSCTVRFGEVSQVLASAAVSKERHQGHFRDITVGSDFAKTARDGYDPRSGSGSGGVVLFSFLYICDTVHRF